MLATCIPTRKFLLSYVPLFFTNLWVNPANLFLSVWEGITGVTSVTHCSASLENPSTAIYRLKALAKPFRLIGFLRNYLKHCTVLPSHLTKHFSRQFVDRKPFPEIKLPSKAYLYCNIPPFSAHLLLLLSVIFIFPREPFSENTCRCFLRRLVSDTVCK